MPASSATMTSLPTWLIDGRQRHGRKIVAAAARTEIRQDDRLQGRRHQEHRRQVGRLDHPPRSSCSALSRKERRGRISTSPARRCRRSTARSTAAGDRASACGCSTSSCVIITSGSETGDAFRHISPARSYPFYKLSIIYLMRIWDIGRGSKAFSPIPLTAKVN